jgi:hypothetical protein
MVTRAMSGWFNFAFIKEFWYFLKDEVRIMFDQFHANEVVLKFFLAYFVTHPKDLFAFGIKRLSPNLVSWVSLQITIKGSSKEIG